LRISFLLRDKEARRMSSKTKKKKTTKKSKKPRTKWFNDWVKMGLVLFVGGAAGIGIGLYCVRFTPGSTLFIFGALVTSMGGLLLLGTVGLVVWKVGDEILLRRVRCPRCHTVNKIPRRLKFYQCSECGRRVRL